MTPTFTVEWLTTTLPALSAKDLLALGCGRWGRREREDGTEYGPMVWLFPRSWYEDLPDGLPIVDLWFQQQTFRRGLTDSDYDSDYRFGCLAFGFEKDENKGATT